MLNLFKSKKQQPKTQYDYEAAFAKLAVACKASTAYSVIMPSVYFDEPKRKFVVHFECAMREYIQKKGKNRFFLSMRRSEKIWGDNLEDVLDFAITYANYDDAFIRSPQDNLPDGIAVSIKNMNRVPGGSAKSYTKCGM